MDKLPKRHGRRHTECAAYFAFRSKSKTFLPRGWISAVSSDVLAGVFWWDDIIRLIDGLRSHFNLLARFADARDFHAVAAGHRAAVAVDVVLPLLDVAADPRAFRIANGHEGNVALGDFLSRKAHAAADFIPLGPGPAATGNKRPRKQAIPKCGRKLSLPVTSCECGDSSPLFVQDGGPSSNFARHEKRR